VYEQEERNEKPHVIVEEYMEGDLYSIDAYISASGKAYCCPPVRYIPAKHLGIDDFFIYKRFVPAGLSDKEVELASAAAQKAVSAVGLTSSSAHIEIIHTKHGWKIIELGPRLGRFRHDMYGRAYGIKHSLNDIKVRLGLEPEIPKTLMEYCCAYSIYPLKEGKLRSIHGLGELEQYEEVIQLKVFAQVGDDCIFAKHGGHSLAELIIATPIRERFDKIIKFTEENVTAHID
jgi:hypothetical protein